MVFVDFANPWLRQHYARWLTHTHPEKLAELSKRLAGWAAAARDDPRPPAVVLDIDEVLLCNVHLNGHAPAGFHAADAFVDPDTKKTWGRADPRDPPLPGARALLAEARRVGLEVFLVTGRLEAIRAITVADLDRAGFELRGLEGGPDTRLWMCPEAPPGSMREFKTGCRACIAKKFRIVATVGDQASDLGAHGDHQVLLPHPFYFTA